MVGLYKLLVPSTWPNIKVSGPIGAVPDTEIVGGRFRCVRSTLPALLSQLTFQVFFKPRPGWREPPRTTIQNFYHMDDFFVVSRSIKELIERRVPGGTQSQAIDMRYLDGSVVPEPYFALKVIRTIDCIDPERSFWRDFLDTSRATRFADSLVTYELSDGLAPEFANAGPRLYRSFPPLRYGARVHLVEAAIPADAALFAPAFWPGQLLVSPLFAEELLRACTGGNSGYYFWTIDPENAGKAYNDMVIAMR